MLSKNNKIVNPRAIKILLEWAFLGLKEVSLSPELDAEVILSSVIGKNMEYLRAHPEKIVSQDKAFKFKKFIERRIKHEPVAYIVGKKEFYGLNFKVNKNTLIPRSETELIVDEVLKIIEEDKKKSDILLFDVGAGSGCIPIAIAKSLEHIYGYRYINSKIRLCAGDISKKTLDIARDNAKMNKAAKYINFFKGDMLENFSVNIKLSKIQTLKHKKIIFITANLPYLSEEIYNKCSKDIRMYEPKNALIAGKDGLKYYKKLFREAKNLRFFAVSQSEKTISSNLWDGIILCEIDPSQKEPIKNLTKKYFPNASLQIKKDLAGLDRLAIIRL
ncbi:MAG: peptide chain release factor N(5)-glutamine methyltransferase [bacterium]